MNNITLENKTKKEVYNPGGGGWGGVLPYVGYMGMCGCEVYGFQAVYSRIGYHFSRN